MKCIYSTFAASLRNLTLGDMRRYPGVAFHLDVDYTNYFFWFDIMGNLYSSWYNPGTDYDGLLIFTATETFREKELLCKTKVASLPNGLKPIY